MRKPYFPAGKDDPAPLRVTVERRVRFEETDPLGIVWHGRYASYFEDGRSAAGKKYGVGYTDFMKNRVVAPIRIIHTDFHHPLKFDETFSIETSLRWVDAAKINMEYVIRNSEGLISTTGYTVQIFLDVAGNLLLVTPPFYTDFREKWRAGLLD